MSTIRIPALLPLALLATLAACGGRDLSIDSEGVARYGAFHYDTDAPQGAVGGAAGATALKPVEMAAAGGAGGGGAAPLPAGVAAEPEGGAAGSKPKKGTKYEVMAVEKGGTIKVSVKLTQAPETPEVKLNKDQKGCGHETMGSGRVAFDAATLGLANAVVYLVDIAKGKDYEGDLAAPEPTVILDQKGCAYVPHVLLVRPGSKVSVKNSDGVQHNAKGFFNNRATLKFNVMSSSNSTLPPSDDTVLTKAGNYILNCDIHQWMTGYIRAVPNPYYAVSGADGTCTLTNVPPGEYRIGCWHEGMLLRMETTGAEITGYKYSDDFDLPVQTVLVPAEGAVDVAFSTDPK